MSNIDENESPAAKVVQSAFNRLTRWGVKLVVADIFIGSSSHGPGYHYMRLTFCSVDGEYLCSLCIDMTDDGETKIPHDDMINSTDLIREIIRCMSTEAADIFKKEDCTYLDLLRDIQDVYSSYSFTAELASSAALSPTAELASSAALSSPSQDDESLKKLLGGSGRAISPKGKRKETDFDETGKPSGSVKVEA